MRTHLLTGAASGIGKATAERLRAAGHRVITVDLRDADIVADLTTAEGRATLVAEATRLAPDGLDGVLAGAGLSNASGPKPAQATLGVNYFGAVATLEGLHPLLARRPGARAVAICSTAALLPFDAPTLDACLAGDEAAALAEAAARPGGIYLTSKRALSLWLRRTAIRPEWAGAGILLNGVAPGVVQTAMTAPLLADPSMTPVLAQSNSMAVTGYAEPGEMAELIDYLLNFTGHYLVGQIIFNDGGTDAIMRPDSF